MRQLTVRVNSITPICHSNVDRAFAYKDPINKEIKRLQQKRKPTDSDRERLEDLHWRVHLYEKEDKPLALGRWLRKGLIVAARTESLGKRMEKAIYDVQDAELILSEPKSIDGLWKDLNYRWTRPVSRGVLATNPVFSDVYYETTILFDETIIDEEDVIRFLKKVRVGAAITMGYGRVSIEVLKSETI